MDNVLKQLEAFVGWLCLPVIEGNKWRSGGGRKIESIRSVFAELATWRTLDSYREFRLAHTLRESEFLAGDGRPVFNNTLRNLFHLAAHLLRAPHATKASRPGGFMFLKPERYIPILEHLLPNTSFNRVNQQYIEHRTVFERWVAYCAKTRGQMFDTLDAATETGQVGKSRSTEAGIEAIIALPDPRVAIADLLNRIERDYTGYGWETTPWEKAFNCRRQVFFELMAIAPHRLRIWAILARRNFTERSGPDGRRIYHLHIDMADFKNHRYIDEDYELDLPARLTPLIDDYFAKAWPILNARIGTFQSWRDRNHGCPFLVDGEGEIIPISKDNRYAALAKVSPSDRVFGLAYGASCKVEDRTPRTPAQKTKNIQEGLQRLTRNATGRFLGDLYKTNGFYPHAFRHIVATAEIKTSGSYERAALLLWDSVETVMKAYAHVKRSDQLAKTVGDQEAFYEKRRRS